MRISAFAGILVSAVTFVALTQDAQASTINVTTLEPESSETVVELLVEKAEAVQQEKEEAEAAVAEEAEEVAPTNHVIAEGESLETIAAQHETTWKRIYDKNEAIKNPDVVTVGLELTIPTSDEELVSRALPEPPAPAPAAPVTRAAVTAAPAPARSVARGASAGNLYVAGYCTWHVKNYRPDLPNNLGNAATWVSRAAAQGIPTGSTPRVGAVGQRGNHVVYIQAVNGDGTVTTTEMNHKGLWVISERVLPASYFTYIY